MYILIFEIVSKFFKEQTHHPENILILATPGLTPPTITDLSSSINAADVSNKNNYHDVSKINWNNGSIKMIDLNHLGTVDKNPINLDHSKNPALAGFTQNHWNLNSANINNHLIPGAHKHGLSTHAHLAQHPEFKVKVSDAELPRLRISGNNLVGGLGSGLF